MPTESGKPLIVISYAHADEPEHPAEGEVKWLSFVTDYLKPAIKSGAIDLWFDRLMPSGAGWEPEIEKKFRACDIFILLVSRHSLSSNYVVDNEIPIIRERQRKGEAVHFYPIVLTPTPKAGLRLVSDKNLRPRDGKPLSDYPLHEWYRHMAEAADEIADLAAKIAARKRLSRRPPPSAEAWEVSPPSADLLGGDARPKDLRIDDRKSLQSWLKEQSREISTAIAVRAALRALPLAFGAAPRRPGRTRSRQLRVHKCGVSRKLVGSGGDQISEPRGRTSAFRGSCRGRYPCPRQCRHRGRHRGRFGFASGRRSRGCGRRRCRCGRDRRRYRHLRRWREECRHCSRRHRRLRSCRRWARLDGDSR
jgi:hypothetical protein